SCQAEQFSDEPRRTDFQLKLSATVFNARLCSGDLVGARRFPGSATDCITRSESIKNCAACPLWVISGHMQRKKACPLYPRKRTCAVQLEMSAMGQKRTSTISFDYLISAAE